MLIIKDIWHSFVCVLKIAKNSCSWISNFIYDQIRFVKYSSTYSSFNDEKCLVAHIKAKSHSVEKRLAFTNSNMGRGQHSVSSLLKMLELYKTSGHKMDMHVFENALFVLSKYCDFQPSQADFRERLNKLQLCENIKEVGGVCLYTRQMLLLASNKTFKDFSASRYSIRDFVPGKIERYEILAALEIAKKAPSACNRQPAKIYVFENDDIKRKIINMLNGISGFEDKITNLCCVTSDMSGFYNIKERNEGYIEGGIFLMSLLLAFHYMGIAACTLNWCVDLKEDKKIRDLVRFEKSENIIAFIAFGRLPEKCFVPVSVRREASKLVTFL